MNILFVIAVIAFVVVFAVIAINNIRVQGELRQSGVTVRATVINRNHEHTVNRDPKTNMETGTIDSYYVTYNYVVGGKTYSRREEVNLGVYDILVQGAPVEVVYLPDKPNVARLASDL